jgi:putative DNA-invertase from lambdoid prophage Rac
MTTFAYLRVSTDNKGQTTDNQRKMITDSGFTIDEFYSEDGVSGSIRAMERPVFSKMLSKMKPGDTVTITMLDRLGRSASDILNVIESMKQKGLKLRVMQFDGIDITSSMGKMVITCMAAMAELERNILIERTVSGMQRTKAQGTKLGPPLSIEPSTLAVMCSRKAKGATLDALASEFGVPRNTIHRNVKQWAGKMDAYITEWNAREVQYTRKGT